MKQAGDLMGWWTAAGCLDAILINFPAVKGSNRHPRQCYETRRPRCR